MTEKMLLLASLVLLFAAVNAQNRPRVIQCPTLPDSPCVCSQGIVDCSNRGLTKMPIFVSSPDHFYMLKLQGNSITQLSEMAFRNLNVSQVFLNDNNIRDIFENAFLGLENSLEILDLQNNVIAGLPVAIGDLNRLRILNVQGNPLDGDDLSDDVLRNLGDTLTEFHFGDSHTIQQWPTSLRHLPNLQVLDVIGGRLPILPPDSFHGFETTLRRFSFHNSSMFSTPLGLARLQNLIEFNFDFHPRIGDAGILRESFLGVLGSLRTLSLRGNGLTRFPEILSVLHSLRTVILDYNNLKYIRDEATQNVRSNITSVGLKSCGLERPPAALSTLTTLENIDMSQNQIGTFERSDLRNLHNLRSLDLSENPLRYISRQGLDDLHHLESLDLSDTTLTTFPRAIVSLPRLINLDLSVPSGIRCTCDMLWLNDFMQTHPSFHVEGSCETVRSTIQNYILSTLPNCQ